MAMQWLESELRKTGSEQDKFGADLISVIREQRGQDIPLPAEALRAIKRFSPEARAAIEKAGYQVYQLTGQSIASLREGGRRFMSTWTQKFPELEALTSRSSEVAIRLANPFLPGVVRRHSPNSKK